MVVPSSGYPAEESDFKVTVTVETEDGFTLRSEKIVSIIDGHSGGEATCTEKAVCEICGEAYGELNPQERHESRRIDNQLRGRSGRQGDAGSSVFYISCEDEVMR